MTGRSSVKARIADFIALLDRQPEPASVTDADPTAGLRAALVALEFAALAEYVRGYTAALRVATGA